MYDVEAMVTETSPTVDLCNLRSRPVSAKAQTKLGCIHLISKQIQFWTIKAIILLIPCACSLVGSALNKRP
jgi:hypothetical protein